MSWDLHESRFAPMLGTNYVPSSIELDQLQVTLLDARDQLGRLTTDIARAQAALDNLLLQEKKIKNYIHAHQALASPIRRIPSETLAEIFFQGLPSDSPYGLRSTKCAPLLLTTVCKHWRDVSIHTPRLWNSLHIHFPSSLTQVAARQRTAGLALWLDRSGTLPIAISVHGSLKTRDSDSIAKASSNMTCLLDSLWNFHDRIQHLTLALPIDDLLILEVNFPSSSPDFFPQLTSLEVAHHHIGRAIVPAATHPYSALLAQMPALKSLVMKTGIRGDVQYHALPCHWVNLTNIEISVFLRSSDLLILLTSTPRLQTLKIGVKVDQDSSAEKTRIILPDATSMRLAMKPHTRDQSPDGIYMDWTCSVFSRISCPALTSLSVSWRNRTPAPKLPFLEMQIPQLKELGLEITMTPAALTECLSMLPSLVSLSLVDLGWGLTQEYGTTLQDSHLRCLCPTSVALEDYLCPQLQEFRMIVCPEYRVWSQDITHWSNGALVDFISSRAINGDPVLKTCDIFIQEKRDFSETQLGRLRALKETGRLKIRIHHPKDHSEPEEDAPTTGIVEPVSEPRIMRDTWPSGLEDIGGEFNTTLLV
ncbi:hypothetical protein D9757_007471 [Collybiopsis confluens]|uniref:F-box domain-containing protein n=1 Tax=Collybiopsis confluens TaxID=2823264 RepID=A0A8H5M8B4_9AGAR|nr:hypothetical protein D9757_007471 [Collybiopsis confluens]